MTSLRFLIAYLVAFSAAGPAAQRSRRLKKSEKGHGVTTAIITEARSNVSASQKSSKKTNSPYELLSTTKKSTKISIVPTEMSPPAYTDTDPGKGGSDKSKTQKSKKESKKSLAHSKSTAVQKERDATATVIDTEARSNVNNRQKKNEKVPVPFEPRSVPAGEVPPVYTDATGRFFLAVTPAANVTTKAVEELIKEDTQILVSDYLQDGANVREVGVQNQEVPEGFCSLSEFGQEFCIVLEVEVTIYATTTSARTSAAISTAPTTLIPTFTANSKISKKSKKEESNKHAYSPTFTASLKKGNSKSAYLEKGKSKKTYSYSPTSTAYPKKSNKSLKTYSYSSTTKSNKSWKTYSYSPTSTAYPKKSKKGSEIYSYSPNSSAYPKKSFTNATTTHARTSTSSLSLLHIYFTPTATSKGTQTYVPNSMNVLTPTYAPTSTPTSGAHTRKLQNSQTLEDQLTDVLERVRDALEHGRGATNSSPRTVIDSVAFLTEEEFEKVYRASRVNGDNPVVSVRKSPGVLLYSWAALAIVGVLLVSHKRRQRRNEEDYRANLSPRNNHSTNTGRNEEEEYFASRVRHSTIHVPSHH